MHPEDIKAAIRKTGLTLTALAHRNRLSESAMRKTLLRPSPRVQLIIANHLGLSPVEIWPDRYDAAGRPLRNKCRNRRNLSGSAAPPHRQKQKAA